METLTDIVTKLINTDTASLIERTAQAILEKPEAMTLNQVNRVFGIILLAVDDAKTRDHPASAATLYKEVFAMAKEILKERSIS